MDVMLFFTPENSKCFEYKIGHKKGILFSSLAILLIIGHGFCDLVLNWVCFIFIIIDKTINKRSSKLMFRTTLL